MKKRGRVICEGVPNDYRVPEVEPDLIEAIFVPTDIFKLIKNNLPAECKEKIIEVKGEILLQALDIGPHLSDLNPNESLSIPDWKKALNDYLMTKAKINKTYLLHGVRFPLLTEVTSSAITDGDMLKQQGIRRRTFLKYLLGAAAAGVAGVIETSLPLKALAYHSEEKTLKQILKLKVDALNDSNSVEVREKAVLALGKLIGLNSDLGRERIVLQAVEALTEVIKAPIPFVLRGKAIEQLSDVSDPKSVESLIGLISYFESILTDSAQFKLAGFREDSFGPQELDKYEYGVYLNIVVEALFNSYFYKSNSLAEIENKFDNLFIKLVNAPEKSTLPAVVSIDSLLLFSNWASVATENKNTRKRVLPSLEVAQSLILKLSEIAEKYAVNLINEDCAYIVKDSLSAMEILSREMGMADKLTHEFNREILFNLSKVVKCNRDLSSRRILLEIDSLLIELLGCLFFESSICIITSELAYPDNLQDRLELQKDLKKAYHLDGKLVLHLTEAISWRLKDIILGKVELNKILRVILHPEFRQKAGSLASGMGTTWSLALACVQNMERFEIEFTEKNISESLELTVNALKKVFGYEIYNRDTQREVILVSADAGFFKPIGKKYKAALKGKRADFKLVNFKEGIINPLGQKDLFTLLAAGKNDVLVVFNAHGSMVNIKLNKGTEVGYKQLAEALRDRVKNGGSLKNVSIIFDTCYSFDYAGNFLSSLYDLLEDEKLPLDLPFVFAAANKNTISYGGIIPEELFAKAGFTFDKDLFKDRVTVKDFFEFQDKEKVFKWIDPALFIPFPEETMEAFRAMSKSKQVIHGRYMVVSSVLNDEAGFTGMNTVSSAVGDNKNDFLLQEDYISEVEKSLRTFMQKRGLNEEMILFNFLDGAHVDNDEYAWWIKNTSEFNIAMQNFCCNLPVNFKNYEYNHPVVKGKELEYLFEEIIKNAYDSIASYYITSVYPAGPSKDYKGRIKVSLCIETTSADAKNLVIIVKDNGLGVKSATNRQKEENRQRGNNILRGWNNKGLERVKEMLGDPKINGEFELFKGDGNQETKAMIKIPLKSLSLKEDVTTPSLLQMEQHGGIDGSTSSPLIPKVKKDIGGIDFRAMPIVNQPMISAQNNFSAVSSSLKSIPFYNDDVEWLQIEKMVNAGIVPSTERIKEYLVSSCVRGDFNKQIDKVLCCFSNILKLEEERLALTDSGMCEILSLLESDKPADEMRAALSRVGVVHGDVEIMMSK